MDICYFCENEAERHLCWCVVSWRDRVSACFPHSDQHASCTDLPSEVPFQKFVSCVIHTHICMYVCMHACIYIRAYVHANATHIHAQYSKIMYALTQMHTNIFPHMHIPKKMHELSRIQSCCAEENCTQIQADRQTVRQTRSTDSHYTALLRMLTYADG